MIFTSYTYALFLFAVFVVHWVLPQRSRKWLLILASYLFYATWKWQFGFLLIGLSLFNWSYARWVLARAEDSRFLAIGAGVNLAALVYFKYTNFLIENAASVAHALGSTWQPAHADIILPLGISFFTFQGIAYLVDVAAGEPPLLPLRDFLLFKAFWPQLIAGPIVRLSEMRPQIDVPRILSSEDVAYGCRRILFGAFKKIVIADNLAPYVEMVYMGHAKPNAIDVVAATIGFALQIYFDFSAYSDIAIGSARLFGFRFPENFNWPYMARSPLEFWNRWHMTLSRWIRDYVFTPLTFATRRRPQMAPLWLLVAMGICGLWHGAQWTFVVWGLWHGLLLVSQHTFLAPVFAHRSDDNTSHFLSLRSSAQTALTFLLVCIGWTFFRAGSIEQAVSLLQTVAVGYGGLRPAVLRENAILLVAAAFAGLIAAQSLKSLTDGARFEAWHMNRVVYYAKPVAYAFILACVVVFDQEARAFVYFQF